MRLAVLLLAFALMHVPAVSADHDEVHVGASCAASAPDACPAMDLGSGLRKLLLGFDPCHSPSAMCTPFIGTLVVRVVDAGGVRESVCEAVPGVRSACAPALPSFGRGESILVTSTTGPTADGLGPAGSFRLTGHSWELSPLDATSFAGSTMCERKGATRDVPVSGHLRAPFASWGTSCALAMRSSMSYDCSGAACGIRFDGSAWTTGADEEGTLRVGVGTAPPLCQAFSHDATTRCDWSRTWVPDLPEQPWACAGPIVVDARLDAAFGDAALGHGDAWLCRGADGTAQPTLVSL